MTNLPTLVVAAVLAMGLSVTACGKKATPEFPSGSSYPAQYPSVEKKSKASAPQPKASPGTETKGGAMSPLGFPLEYPNRRTY